MDTAIRTLRLRLPRGGDPMPLSSAESSQRERDIPIPKELGLPSLEGGMSGS